MTQKSDIARLRQDFPILSETMRGKPLVYLDNAASTQKPQVVIERMEKFYRSEYANIHRGVYELSQNATVAYEAVREKVKTFLNAASGREIIFVRGTTEAINLVAQSYGRSKLKAGDEILITAMEHHSNIVPWQLLCEQIGAVLRVAPMNHHGELLLDEFEKLLSPKTKFVSIVHVSNALGTINPVKKMIALAHAHGIPVLVDGAQAVSHLSVDVQDLGCDFYAFSGHKLFGPSGVGVLYGRTELLNAMPPYQGGGDMILSVTFEKTLFNEIPHKFEAGTPDIAGVIAFGAALDYLATLDGPTLQAHEAELLEYATKQLAAIPQLRFIGTAKEKTSVLSFVLDAVHPHDIGTVLDMQGVAIRAGHHCAQPVMDFFGVSATTRASLAFYNTREDIDQLVRGLHKVVEIFC